MNPAEEDSLQQEVQQLRRQLDHLNSRILKVEEKIFTQAAPTSAPVRPTIPERRPQSDPAPPPLPSRNEPSSACPSAPPSSHGELDFGKVWFVRIGIVILLTGLVFLGNYAYQNWIREMPNGVRLAALFACSFALAETGRRLATKSHLNRFGEVLLAGGMAFFYYCTFAAHHVAKLKVIDNPVIGAGLIFVAAGLIAGVSYLRKSQATAIFGIVLASYATMLQPIGWMSCFSSILLGMMGLAFMLRPGWAGPGWASMLGSYGAFIGWQLLGASGGKIRTDDPVVLWFLVPLWVIFAIPGVLGRFRESLSDRARAWFTGLNNSVFSVLFSTVWIVQNGQADYWKVAAIFGPILLAMGALGRKQEAAAGGVNMFQGLAISTLAIVLKLDGQNLALVLAFEALALAMASWKFRGKSEAAFAIFTALGSVGLVLGSPNDLTIIRTFPYQPTWIAAMIVLLLAAASAVFRKNSLPSSRGAASVLAILGVLIAVFALHAWPAEHWIDSLAGIALLFLIASLVWKPGLLFEAAAVGALSVAGLLLALFSSGWSIHAGSGWRGNLVIAALLASVLTYRLRPALIADRETRRFVITFLAGLACLVLTLWATQMLVWRMGWKPTAILWTLLGFTFVSGGLWQRLHIIRLSGFLLLVLAVGKTFLHDVWDFTTFMRVVSFIVLGTALILLGLFYNKFADAIRALLEDEKAPSSAGEIRDEPES